MNWKNTVSKLNARHYAFPAGWDTRDTIADQLECAPDRVDTLLAPGLKSGEIEKQQFPVWDPRLGRKNLIWGYRHRPASDPTPTTKSPTNAKITIVKPASAELTTAIQAMHARHPHLTPSRLREYLPKRHRASCTKDQVAIIIGGK
jgi:hypothetical protein